MSRILIAGICGWILFRSTNRWQRIVSVVLITTVTLGLIFPSPAYSQFGLLGSIQNILNVINGAIRSTLNLIGTTSQSLQTRYQQIIWPVQRIDETRNAIASLITQFRAVMRSIERLLTVRLCRLPPGWKRSCEINRRMISQISLSPITGPSVRCRPPMKPMD